MVTTVKYLIAYALCQGTYCANRDACVVGCVTDKADKKVEIRLPRRALRILYCLDGGLVVGEDGAPCRGC